MKKKDFREWVCGGEGGGEVHIPCILLLDLPNLIPRVLSLGTRLDPPLLF